MNKIKDLFLNLFENKISIPKEVKEEYGDFEEVKKFVEKIRIKRWVYIVAKPCLQIFNSYLQVLYIFLQSQLNDSFINNSKNLTVSLIVNYILFRYVLSYGVSQFTRFLNSGMYLKNQNTRKYLLEHVLTLDYNFFEANKTSQITRLFSEGDNAVTYLITPKNIIQSITSYIQVFGQVIFILKMCPWKISLMSLLLSISIQLLNKLIQQAKLKQEIKASNNIQFEEFLLDDTLKNVSLIKQFGTERKEIDKLYKTLKNNKDYENFWAEKQQTFLEKIVSFIQLHTIDIFTLSLLAQLYLMRKNDPFETRHIAADFSLILSYSFAINQATTTIFYQVTQWFSGKQASNFSYMLMNMIKLAKFLRYKSSIPTCITEEESQKQNGQLIGDIHFKNVCFKYPQTFDLMATMNQIRSKLSETEQDKKKEIQDINSLEVKEQPKEVVQNVLDDISFEIKSGQFVSFVGKSGSGKSTIVKLIQRFYNISSGDILFDGQSMDDVSIVKLKNSIGFVSQDPCLLDADIETNITYGNQEQYSQEYLKEICDISGVSEFIFDKKRFPQQLKTLVGQNGAKLSGGQKQRIAIARALFKKPQILILDEATSSLDAESEYIVQQYIDKLVDKRGMTIIVVAHRLSTIIKSDTIFVMEQGKIVEKGSHKQLLQLDGVYKKLISHQIHS